MRSPRESSTVSTRRRSDIPLVRPVARPGRRLLLATFLSALIVPATAHAQCPEEPPAQHYTGGGEVTCPCFIAGEQAGMILTLPASDFPIEVLRVGIGWASVFGGAPSSLEEAIHVYDGGLPDPGAPIASLPGPVLTDGFINEFDLEPLAGEIIASGPDVSVTLEFLNSNAGSQFAPSVIQDGNGCQPGKNLVLAIPGGWFDACVLGVTGDWVFFVIYRPVSCSTGVAGEAVASSVPAALLGAQPNPFQGSTDVEFFVEQAQSVDIAVFDVAGRKVAQIADRVFGAGAQRVQWDGVTDAGQRVAAGTYFIQMQALDFRATRKLVVDR